MKTDQNDCHDNAKSARHQNANKPGLAGKKLTVKHADVKQDTEVD
jgi:hypothetical protein